MGNIIGARTLGRLERKEKQSGELFFSESVQAGTVRSTVAKQIVCEADDSPIVPIFYILCHKDRGYFYLRNIIGLEPWEGFRNLCKISSHSIDFHMPLSIFDIAKSTTEIDSLY